MDKRWREQVAAWLDFYRELGIEEFHRRKPGAGTGAKPAAAVAPSREEEKVSLAADVGGPSPAPAALPPSATTVRAGVNVATCGPPARSLSLFEAPARPPRAHETLEQIQEDLGDCQRCRLAAGRKTIVFGQGNPHAEVVFVGEGPGADEDAQGLPFVGRAGQLLNRMIQFIGMKREDVYICNVVKCRPPGNRTPEKDEVDACSPFLFRQIEAIKPRLICCLGAPAVKTLLGVKEGIMKIRGQFFRYGGAGQASDRPQVLATVHPAYVLRNPREEKTLREDFEKLRDFLRKPR